VQPDHHAFQREFAEPTPHGKIQLAVHHTDPGTRTDQPRAHHKRRSGWSASLPSSYTTRWDTTPAGD